MIHVVYNHFMMENVQHMLFNNERKNSNTIPTGIIESQEYCVLGYIVAPEDVRNTLCNKKHLLQCENALFCNGNKGVPVHRKGAKESLAEPW